MEIHIGRFEEKFKKSFNFVELEDVPFTLLRDILRFVRSEYAGKLEVPEIPDNAPEVRYENYGVFVSVLVTTRMRIELDDIDFDEADWQKLVSYLQSINVEPSKLTNK